MPTRAAPWLLAILGGVLYFEGFIGHGHYTLSWICLAPALVAVRNVSPRRALGIGTLFGFVTHLGGYSWIVHLLMEFAGAPWAVAFLGYVALCAAQGFQLAVFVWLSRLIALRTGRPIGWIAPFVFVAVEAFYPMLFPSYLANSQLPFPLATQILDLGGPLLLGFVMALVSGAVADLLISRLDRRSHSYGLPLTATIAFALTLAYGAWAMPRWTALEAAAPKLRIGIAQSNVGAADNHLRWDESWHRNQRLSRQLATVGAELVVWGEGGYMGWVRTSEKRLPQIPGADAAVLTGISRYNILSSGQREDFNGAALIDKSGDVLGAYDKIDLLAFGEYIPLGETFPLLYKLAGPYGSHFTRGHSVAPITFGRFRVGAFICFEDILPSRVRAIAQGAPHVLVNVTNDSWYGRGAEQEIHLALAAFRSIEQRRWLVRSTNTGISAFVDAEGRIVEQSGRDMEAALVRDVPMLEGGTIYLALGDWVGWLCAGACAVELLRTRRTKREATTLPPSKKQTRSNLGHEPPPHKPPPIDATGNQG